MKMTKNIFNPTPKNEAMSQGSRLAGSAKGRAENDFYPTPNWGTESLMKVELFSGITGEPACGDGAMSKVLEAHGLNVISTDLIYRGYGVGGIDFLTSDMPPCNNIITNPPFYCAKEFVEKSKNVATDKIAMLLKTVFLETSDRYDMFQDTVFPLARVYQFSRRLTLWRNGIVGKNGGTAAYAWFVWDKKHIGAPTIHWIK